MTTDGEPDADAGREPEPDTARLPDESSDDGVLGSAVESGESGLADVVESAERSTSSAGPKSKLAAKRKSGKKPVAKPQTITELFRYVYQETGAGRKLNLSRSLWDMGTTPFENAQQEIAEVRKLAADDHFLDALASLMVEIADIELKDSVRRQILKLAQVAFASHELFTGRVERLVEPAAEPRLTATEISHAAGVLRLAELDNEESLEISAAKRERLRVNAVTSFALFRVMHDKWSKEQFIHDFCDLVWRVPSRFQAPERSDNRPAKRTDDFRRDEASVRDRADWRTVAMLADAKSAAEPLSELKRYFEAVVRDREKKIASVMEEAAAQSRRAERERETASSLLAELVQKNSHISGLEARVADLEGQLEKEQRGRFADEVHAVDDYENLRTQIIRQLSGQVNLLHDGLHALRNGSIAVADEFIDRALSKIDAEIKRLKELAQ
jgi:hypothetical protein